MDRRGGLGEGRKGSSLGCWDVGGDLENDFVWDLHCEWSSVG